MLVLGSVQEGMAGSGLVIKPPMVAKGDISSKTPEKWKKMGFRELLKATLTYGVLLYLRDARQFIETTSKFARENWWLEEDPTSFCDLLSSGVFAVSFREGNKQSISVLGCSWYLVNMDYNP